MRFLYYCVALAALFSMPFAEMSAQNNDLTIGSLSVDDNFVNPGDYVTISFSLNSGGFLPTVYNDRICVFWLEPGHTQLRPSDDVLATFGSYSHGRIPSNRSLSQLVRIPPNSFQGWHRIRVFADSGESIDESNEGNNGSDVWVYVSGPTKPAALMRNTRPQHTWLSGGQYCQSGDEINIGTRVANRLPGQVMTVSVPTTITEIYLSSDDTYSPGDIYLDDYDMSPIPAESLDNSPQAANGQSFEFYSQDNVNVGINYVIWYTDAGDEVNERSEFDNFQDRAFNVVNCFAPGNDDDPQSLNTYQLQPVDIDISISPNPTTDLARVTYPVIKGVTTNLRLLDLNGRVVQSQSIEWLEQTGMVDFQIGELPTGVYLMEYTNGHETITKKIVKN